MMKLTPIHLRYLAIALILPGMAAAEIYKQVLPDGSVVFSDQPAPGAERIEVAPAQTYKPPPIPVSSPRRSAEKDREADARHYDELRITTPEDDAPIRENAGNVHIEIAVSPALRVREGHKIVLYMDGEPVAEPGTRTVFDLKNVDRGTHQLQAAIVDAAGKPLKTSDPVTFHLLRISIIRPQPFAP